jgi:hypothetical protein
MPLTSAAGVALEDTFYGETVTFVIQAGAVTTDKVLTVTNAGSTDLTQVGVSIAGWVYGTDHFVSGKPVKITMPKNLLPNTAMAYTNDGITWVRIPLVETVTAITNHVIGDGYTDNGATVTIYSYHLTTFGAHIFAAVKVHVPDPLQLSSISSMVPETSTFNTVTPIVISGTFTEKIANISLNDINMAAGSWTQTPTTVSLSMPAGALGIYSIQIWNGSVPLLPIQAFTIAAASEEAARVAARVAAIELTLSLGKTTKSLFSTKCVKGKTTKYVKYGAKCPKGYKKK